MKTIKMKIRGKFFEVEPRKEGEDRNDYRQYLEDCYRMKFPYKKYRKFRIIKRIRQFDLQEKSLDKMERKSYNYTFKKTGINFDGPDYLIRALFGGSNEKRKEIKENKKSERKAKRENKKENKFIGFFKNLFNRKNKNTEETFEENLPELVELTEDDLPDLEETFEENIHEDDMIFEENIHDDDIIYEENLPEERKEKTPVSLPIELKSCKEATAEDIERFKLKEENNKLKENLNDAIEVIKKSNREIDEKNKKCVELEQENAVLREKQDDINSLKKELIELRRELIRRTYNPNSAEINKAYEEAVKENQYREVTKHISSYFDKALNNIQKVYINDNNVVYDDNNNIVLTNTKVK